MNASANVAAKPAGARPPNTRAAVALLVVIVGIATILGVYYFQYVLGYQPCPLCLDQRIPYYIAIPLAAVVAIAARGGAPRGLVTTGLVIVGLLMLADTAIAAFHAGVEWKWWPGPVECSGPMNQLGQAGSLIDRMQKIIVVRCDEAAWRLMGISLAGYNVVITLALGLVALWGAFVAKL